MTKLARKKIDEAIKNKSKSLNLGKCGLETIPDEVLEMTWLEELILNNRIWDNHKKVWIENKYGIPNKINTLPNNIQSLTHLKSLRIGGDFIFGNYHIDNIGILQNLSGLTSLDIRSNNISDASFLKNLSGLTSLYISSNKQIKDFSFLKNLSGLTSLDISYNNISDASFLKNLSGLTSLDISYNKQIKDFSFLKNLSGLTSLDISYNNISDASFLKNLSGLTSLYIRSNNISDASFLKNLSGLTSLDIRSNKQIKDFSFLKNLSGLTSLDISSNNISDASFLKNLSGLTSLDISSNNISDASFLKNLSGLTSLDISSNNISDASFLKNLSGLTSLDISSNNISDASFLKNLSGLTSLDISSNKQIKDFSFLKNLSGLTSLDIRSNNISDASFLKNLSGLTSLYIRSNNISDASFLKNLSGLTSLDISNNKVEDFNFFLPLLRKGIPVKLENDFERIGMYLYNNPWSSPPVEVIKNGREAILEYFLDVEQHGKAYLYEAKMIIVGRGGAGKTSLIRKLRNRSALLPEEEKTTKGIDIDKFPFINNEGKEFIVNIWDFGGQEIYHATHQFFLTRRSLYILVDDTKDDDKTVNDASFKYWLQTVELFGDNSPLIIFQNEKGGRSKDLDIKSMQARFGFIKERHSDDLLEPKDGLDKFEKAVKYNVQKLPQIGQVLPNQWIKIRKELFQMAAENHYVLLERYFDICTRHGITEKSAMLNLSQYLHDLGTFLHFQNDDLLRKTIILKNEWATDAVYKVLDNELIKKKKGVFTKKDVASIWKESIYAEMHPELLSLMVKFELCYQMDNKNKTFLIPQLLPESRPKNFYWSSDENLQLRYKYEFMPKGLLSRYMIRMNTYLKDIKKSWKNGVILEKGETFAFVEEKYAINEIAIRIRGNDKKEMLTIVAEHMDILNKEYEGIKVEKLIPCNCSKCKDLENPHFYEYDNIVERYKDRQTTVGCYHKPYENVPLSNLLDNFYEDPLDHIFSGDRGSGKGFESKYEAKTINIIQNLGNESSVSSLNVEGNISLGNENKDINISSKESVVEQKTSIIEKDAHENRKASLISQWWLLRLIGAFCSGLFAMIVAWWFEWCHPFSAFLVVFPLLSVLLLYMGNPARRFFRAAIAAFSAAMSVFILQLGFTFNWSQKIKDGNFKLALEWLTEYDWLVGICILALAALLFWMDWKKDKNESSK